MSCCLFDYENSERKFANLIGSCGTRTQVYNLLAGSYLVGDVLYKTNTPGTLTNKATTPAALDADAIALSRYDVELLEDKKLAVIVEGEADALLINGFDDLPAVVQSLTETSIRLRNFSGSSAQPTPPPSGGLTVGKYDFDFGGGIIEYKGVAPANVIGSPPENPAFGSLNPTNYLGLEIDAFIVGSNPAFGISIVQFGNTVTGVADLGDINVIVDGVPYLLLYDIQQSNYINDGAVADALFNALQDGQNYTFDVQLAN